MAERWLWPGSRWWKCDLHLHTPASDDFRDDGTTAEQWIQGALDAELDVVAVTDHNACGGINGIQAAASRTKLVVLPGIELSVTPGIHILALFDPDTDVQAPASLLGASRLPPEDVGKSNAIAPVSVEDALDAATARSGLAIAAHADGPKGILRDLPKNKALARLLACKNLIALEINDGTDASLMQLIDGSRPDFQRDNGLLPVLTCSDAHRLSEIGRRATWIKMTKPTLEGLRLALQDGQDSVVCSRDIRYDNPNVHADLVVESVEIRNARYIGRMSALGPLIVPFNPWLNTLIGGRGTGKSSIVEFLRKAMRRDHELSGHLQSAFEEIMSVAGKRHDRGLLLADTTIQVVYRKGDERYRIQWSPSGAPPPIELIESDGSATPVDGKVTDHFPIRIYSQKQVFELATDPAALLGIIDDAREVDGQGWKNQFDAEVNQFLAIRAKIRSLSASLEDAPRTEIALADLNRKIAVFEGNQHADVLKTYRQRQRQQIALDEFGRSLADGLQEAESLLDFLTPASIDQSLFESDDPVDAAMLASLQSLANDFADMRQRAAAILEQAKQRSSHWQSELTASTWRQQVHQAETTYQALVDQLQAQQIADPSEYGRLLQERQLLENKLKGFAASRGELSVLEQQAQVSLAGIHKLRRTITQRRQDFLNELNVRNELVRVEVSAYGHLESAEAELRALLMLNDGTYERVIGTPGDDDRTILGSLYPASLTEEMLTGPLAATDFESRLQGLKERIVSLHRLGDAEADQRFVKAVQRVPVESLDRLHCWFPQDTLVVSYKPLGQNGNLRPIAQGSPGQKTAAMLAFILSYGEEPIVLDQPEDDLDNQLIYDLIVRQIREVKQRRQVIVVTHNANIVVNGDAELILALESKKGQTVIDHGGLQENRMRERICAIMEGGKQAFEQRYRRIALGS